jgi:single-strand DNA-binding protein
MASLNRIQLIGNIGQDPEVRQAGQSSVVTFSVATTDRWTDKGGQKQEKTEWHRVEAWGRTAEAIAEFTRKGSQIFVEGSLTTEKYTDKDGIERYSTKVKAANVQFLDRRQGGDEGYDQQ